ncbi:hypothetical protein RR46_08282 [Papilio xuthus]|uniref:Uncharacterized protein n=1 Tax=Papilio xuthus TaxID=66420 RepID=A0A194PER8_PAPXU|nr:hypothetical protein RR46_08282 [Papilio xuthus]
MQCSLGDLNVIYSEPQEATASSTQLPAEPEVSQPLVVASSSVDTAAKDSFSDLLDSDDFLKDGYYSQHFLGDHFLDDNNLLAENFLSDSLPGQDLLDSIVTEDIDTANPTLPNFEAE